MIWKRTIKQKLNIGDIRVIRKFAILPTCTKTHWVWMQHYYVKQQFMHYTTYDYDLYCGVIEEDVFEWVTVESSVTNDFED
jgi:hypothetical protein